jgi:beta-glucosidase
MTLEYLSQWPHIQSGYAKNSSDESEIERILALMTLEEKVAQMIQPEMFELTPEDAGKFKFGSALNGAGIWPGGQRHAKVADWVNTVNAYWQAVNRAFAGRPFRIPFMWASDARPQQRLRRHDFSA